MDNEVKLYYTNQIQIAMTQFDLNFTVKHKLGKDTVDQCNVVMSPQHFKEFVKTLNNSLKEYEDLFGPLDNNLIPEAFEKMKQEGKLNFQITTPSKDTKHDRKR